MEDRQNAQALMAEALAGSQDYLPKRGRPYLYFVGLADRRIKIGFSTNVKARMRKLQVGIPVRLKLLATMPGSRTSELSMHRAFAADRIEGEWFRPTPLLHQLIALINERYGA